METWFWILSWSLSILTVAGNGFIIFLVCSKQQLRTKTNAFVVSLAVPDFCVGLTVVPPMFFCEKTTWCKPQSYEIKSVRWLFGSASAANLCSLVLDRYIAVVKPLKYLTFMTRRRVIQMVSLSWGIRVVLSTIFVLDLYIFKITILFDISLWVSAILFEFLPCFILIFCFSSMLYAIRTRNKAKQFRLNDHRVSFKPQVKSTAAVKLMAVVIGLFLLCYVFYLRCTLVYVPKNGECNDEEYKIPLLVLNSAINPVAYAFLKRDIKKEIKNMYLLRKGRSLHPVNNCFTVKS